MAEKNPKTKKMKEKLFFEPSRVWDKLSKEERVEAYAYAKGYIDFLNLSRTERRAAKAFTNAAESRGFAELAVNEKQARVFRSSRGKLVAMAVLGKKPLTEGLRLIVSHTDAPRLDLKPSPLYEESSLAMLKTHYYGGIKKYQWVARSLALVGMVVLTDGRAVEVEIGLDPGDPIVTIPDLLPHLGRKQMEKKASEFIPGENLNLLVAGIPFEDKDTDNRVKLAFLNLLHEKYGIKEEDLTSAELQAVPAEPARDAGLDGCFVAGYGQDDRISAYTSFTALMETQTPEHTAVVGFFDKEEIGSEGNTSAQSRFLEAFVMDLMEQAGIAPSSRRLTEVLMASKALSADVNAAFDPNYADVFDKLNVCRLGYGVTVEKYTGSGGKYNASDASAEFASWLRKLFNDSGIVWQTGGHGKIDEGGGGTLAKFLARTGMDIIDVGPAMLGMHSPLEITSKEDVWMCHKAFKVFLNS
ncbi:MAG: aminopeptidase [Thermodesulfobacteriota bacterium]